MNFAKDLERQLTAGEWALCGRYVSKAQELFDDERDAEAREALKDAVAVCVAAGENNAAGKVRYYLRFC